MSYGDINTWSIPTVYKGIQMRSRLETKIAFFLDSLNIKWEYEPKTFLLSNGIMYKPDFYLTELKQWIEVKGIIGKNNIDISETFCLDNNTDLFLWSGDSIIFFERFGENKREILQNEHLQIGKCSTCGKYFLCGNLGVFSCGNCGSWNGDHDILYDINEDIDFSDNYSIKDWLRSNKIKW